MTDYDLIEEIHRIREKVARECDFDVHKMAERIRQRERRKECCTSRRRNCEKDGKPTKRSGTYTQSHSWNGTFNRAVFA